LIEIDRPRLEAAACECYQFMRRRIDRIVLTEKMKPPPPKAEASLFTGAEEVRPRSPAQASGQRPRHHH